MSIDITLARTDGLTYDDVQLIPHLSSIDSRSKIDLSTSISRLPFIASPMDTICGLKMAVAMYEVGGIGCLHRFCESEDQATMVRLLRSNYVMPIAMAAIGVSDYKRPRLLVEAGATHLLIDVAHGHHTKVEKMVTHLKEEYPDVVVIGGSISTEAAATDLADWGCDMIRVGQGNGSLCTTRIETGFGIPSLTSIADVVQGIAVSDNPDCEVIADGGIRSAGDIAKAIAFGADFVMLGSLIAGTDETPNPIIERQSPQGIALYKEYRGAASLATKKSNNLSTSHVEGVSTLVPYKGKVKYIIRRLEDGLRSALSYNGSHDLSNFKHTATAIMVTGAGMAEARPHLIS